MSNTLTLPLHLVLIDQGATVLAPTVPEHEIAVLKTIHGRENVTSKGKTEDDIELSASAEAEWSRLSRKYRRTNAPDMVSATFRVGPSQFESFGFSMDNEPDAIAPQASQRKHAKPVLVEKKSKAA